MSSSKTGEATPRPWELGGLDHVASIYSEVDLRTVADRLTVADARLIVESVNSYDALQAQNKLLREALEFYANPANLEQFATTGSNDFKGTAWGEIDDGISNVARAALKDKEPNL